jgi:hypothetical protein
MYHSTQPKCPKQSKTYISTYVIILDIASPRLCNYLYQVWKSLLRIHLIAVSERWVGYVSNFVFCRRFGCRWVGFRIKTVAPFLLFKKIESLLRSSPGVDVMIIIFCDFCQFSAKQLAFFSNFAKRCSSLSKKRQYFSPNFSAKIFF